MGTRKEEWKGKRELILNISADGTVEKLAPKFKHPNKWSEFIKNQIMLNCREKKAVDITYSPFQGFSLFSMILLLPNGESRYR